jgi:hypothetical protein
MMKTRERYRTWALAPCLLVAAGVMVAVNVALPSKGYNWVAFWAAWLTWEILYFAFVVRRRK